MAGEMILIVALSPAQTFAVARRFRLLSHEYLIIGGKSDYRLIGTGDTVFVANGASGRSDWKELNMLLQERHCWCWHEDDRAGLPAPDKEK